MDRADIQYICLPEEGFEGVVPVAPLNFGNGEVISSHTLQSMWLLIHAGIKVNPG